MGRSDRLWGQISVSLSNLGHKTVAGAQIKAKGVVVGWLRREGALQGGRDPVAGSALPPES